MSRQLADAIAISQATPGPLFAVATFILLRHQRASPALIVAGGVIRAIAMR